MSELLPCPFCGGEAEVLTAESMHGGYLFGIMCNDCRSRGDVYDNEAEAIATWNTRAERTCKVAACYDTAYVDSCGSNAEWYFAFTCGDELYWDEPEPPNYCPNCGAKVVGE